MCGKKRGRNKGKIWCWNEEVKEAASKMKTAHKVMCQNSIEENKRRHKRMKAKKALSKSNEREG